MCITSRYFEINGLFRAVWRLCAGSHIIMRQRPSRSTMRTLLSLFSASFATASYTLCTRFPGGGKSNGACDAPGLSYSYWAARAACCCMSILRVSG